MKITPDFPKNKSGLPLTYDNDRQVHKWIKVISHLMLANLPESDRFNGAWNQPYQH